MGERSGERRDTYVPPTPENTKPKGSRDNAVEMAAGGEAEREALEAQRKKMTQPSGATTDPGRTDNPHGTGVGYAGEGSTAYGKQEADMSTGDQKRTGDMGQKATTPQRQAEQQHQQQHPSSGQKPGGSGDGGSQQSTGSKPPTQGTGSTPQSHTSGSDARPQHDQSSAQGGTSTVTPTTSQTTPGVMGGTKDHNASEAHNAGEFVQSHGGGSSSSGGGVAAQAQQKADDLKDTAQSKTSDMKDQAQTALTGMKDQASQRVDDARSQAQGKFNAVTTQAQDTLESVRANVQMKSDQLKETMTGRTDHLKETVSGKTDQLMGTVGDKGEQVKQAANDKSTQAGGKLTDLADTLREKSGAMGTESPVANVATKAAGALHQTGSYLQESTPDDWMGDLKQLISRKPFESVLVAAGLGYMAARAFKK
jgi:uncharacterized protein YjbJ (UPF0337 family)